jgi:hypothetical protein
MESAGEERKDLIGKGVRAGGLIIGKTSFCNVIEVTSKSRQSWIFEYGGW